MLKNQIHLLQILIKFRNVLSMHCAKNKYNRFLDKKYIICGEVLPPPLFCVKIN